MRIIRNTIFIIGLIATIILSGCSNTNLGNDSEVSSNKDKFSISFGNGQLEYEILEENIYDSLSDANITKDEIYNLGNDFFKEDSDSLIDGLGLLIVEFKVKNDNAVCCFFPENDLLFRADTVFLVTKENSNIKQASSMVYFNEHSFFTEHPFAYELSKGESKTIKVGYIVDKKRLTDTFLSNCSAYSKKAFYIPLEIVNEVK